ncbi:MAG: DNA repair protein RadA [Chloroflexi bacterium]|nr:DNA repair protein RadA [Chloroflexota bacterium]
MGPSAHSGALRTVAQAACGAFRPSPILVDVPLAKPKVAFVCQQCGFDSPKWIGRCPQCDGWNTFVEERVVPAPKGRDGSVRSPRAAIPLSDVPDSAEDRIPTGIGELDRVLGGGIVPGSLVLLGGDPGIGKSSLLMQASGHVAARGRVLYVSGEESAAQVKLRTRRFGIDRDGILLLPETDLSTVIETIRSTKPILVVVDSIQTMTSDAIGSAAGGVSQLRECAARLLEVAKGEEVPIFLIGHVTKEGAVAGPRVLEHIVDAVLYLEGERFHSFRVLRATKDRFGSTDEVGVFEMGERGLTEVADPSGVFLEERGRGVPGSVVVPTLEGTRPLLVEVQALVAPTSFGLPRRTANGADLQRVILLLAVLGKRAGLSLGQHDVYVNLVGGLRVREPATDLAVAIAIASALRDRPADPRAVFVGELGLGGEVRRVQRLGPRLREAERLGFERAIVPAASARDLDGTPLEIVAVKDLREAVQRAGVSDADRAT